MFGVMNKAIKLFDAHWNVQMTQNLPFKENHEVTIQVIEDNLLT